MRHGKNYKNNKLKTSVVLDTDNVVVVETRRKQESSFNDILSFSTLDKGLVALKLVALTCVLLQELFFAHDAKEAQYIWLNVKIKRITSKDHSKIALFCPQYSCCNIVYL